MKTLDILNYWLYTALICLIFGACSNDDEYTTSVEIESGNLKAVTYDSVQFSGKVISGNPKEIGACWSINPNPTIDDSYISMGTENGAFECNITGLSEGTQYYVRAWAKTVDNTITYGEQKYCITMAHGRPIVYVTDIIDVTEVNATIISKLLVDGGMEISDYGIIYGTEEGIDLQKGHKISLDVTCNAVKTFIEGLSDNQTYFVRCFATANGKTVYSKVIPFKTKAYANPIIQVETENVTGDAFDAKVTAMSGTPLLILEYGLVYAKESEPSIENGIKVEFGKGDGNKTQTVENLNDDTIYYVRPYAINKNGIYYGEEVLVLTLSNKAMVTTIQTSFITAHRAKIGGEILSLGLKNAPIVETGVCWSTNPSPTIENSTIKSVTTEIGEFEPLQLFCLDPSTKYYARAYVTNEYGTNYGEEVTFTTREAVGNYFVPKTDGNYFNGLNMTDSYPGPDTAYSAYQKEAYEVVKTITAMNGRNFTAYRYYVYANEAGEPAYLEANIAYSNSAGTNYRAMWRTKMDISDNYVYTCSCQEAYTNTANYINTAKKNALEEKLSMATDFIINDAFVLDWEDETSTTIGTTDRNAVIYMIPIHSPENYLRMGVFRVTGLKAYTDWW